MIAIGLLLVRMLCDCFKSRRRLEGTQNGDSLLVFEAGQLEAGSVSVALGHGFNIIENVEQT
jgi:hypothetical protein